MTDALAMSAERDAVSLALQDLKALEVRDQATLTQLNTWLLEGKRRAKEIESLEQTVNKPLNEALKANRAIYKPVLDLYKQFETLLKSKVSEGHAYLAREQARQLQEAAKAYQEAKTEQDRQQASTALMQVTDAPEHKGTSIRKVWKYRVLDISLVPSEYVVKTENAVVIRAAVAAGARDIPGIQIYEDEIVTVRA